MDFLAGLQQFSLFAVQLTVSLSNLHFYEFLKEDIRGNCVRSLRK